MNGWVTSYFKVSVQALPGLLLVSITVMVYTPAAILLKKFSV